MEGKGGWASDCLAWWVDLTFLWRLFSGPHDKKAQQMCGCFTSSRQVYVMCSQDCDLVMCSCSSKWHDHHDTALVLSRLSFRGKSSCWPTYRVARHRLKQYIIMNIAWRLGVKRSRIVALLAQFAWSWKICHVCAELSYEPMFPTWFCNNLPFFTW
jgi:hypothetical protein